MSAMQPIDFAVIRQPWDFTIGLYVRATGVHGPQTRAIADPIVFREVTNPGGMSEPTLKITEEEGQALMDALWRAGLRPADGHGSTGQLAATEKHLEDMRGLAFDAIKAQRDLVMIGKIERSQT